MSAMSFGSTPQPAAKKSVRCGEETFVRNTRGAVHAIKDRGCADGGVDFDLNFA